LRDDRGRPWELRADSKIQGHLLAACRNALIPLRAPTSPQRRRTDRTAVHDEVAYTVLTRGREYQLTGTLMDKQPGEAVASGGKTVTSTVPFVPDSADGTQTVTFTFAGTDLSGHEVVTFESLDPDVLCDEFASQEDSSTQMPTDEEVRSAFTGETRYINLQTRGILYLIESKERPANSSTVLLGFDGYSLEHLMLKKWHNNWGCLATEEGERNRDAILLTLGNLAIITQALNASIRDADWATKKAGKNGAPGLEGCAVGITTMDGVLSAAAWDEEKIHERAKRLADMAVRVWPK
jgi:hypothetical protein